jgi:hypothetical protein
MPRSYRSILLALLILVGGLAAPAPRTSASDTAPVEMQSMPGIQVITYYAGPTDHPVNVPPPGAFLRGLNGVRAQTANISVNYNPGFTVAAQTAFEYAVTIWESLITSPVKITVDAYWMNLGNPLILGAAGARTASRDFAGAPMPGTWYPAALANKLAGSDISSGYEIVARFNSAFGNWYFGTDGNPGSQVDFASVVLHELGHGLGFSGSMMVGGDPMQGGCSSSNLGCWGRGTGFPFIYDRFAVNGSNQLLLSSYANNSPDLADQLTSGSIFFNGTNAVKANRNANVSLYAPDPWAQGSSYSHLDNVFDGTPNALMTYSIGSGESIHDPGPVTLCMFKDMGWTVTVSGASAASPLTMSAPGFAVFLPDNVTAADGSTVYLPLIMNGYSTAPC